MERDKSIDILRAIALIGMIIAHCKPHWIIMQLREFDVPLIVFLSGVSYVMSAKRKPMGSYWSYCWKRFKRLAFPAWFFLVIYYAVLFIGLNITGNIAIDWNKMLNDFTFTNGWYLWIIRVFLIIALLAPPVYSLTRKMTAFPFLLIFFVLLVGYEFIASDSRVGWYYYLTMAIPYVLIFALGTMSDSFTDRHFFLVAIIALVMYSGLAIYYYKVSGGFQISFTKKYPPRLYYTSFAIAIIALLWTLRKHITSVFVQFKLSDAFTFIGSHTLWIYFWHIIFLLLLETRIHNSALLFCIVFLLAVVFDYVQVRLVKWIINNSNCETLNKNLSLFFLG